MIPVPKIDDVHLVFGTVSHLPKWEDIPKEFKNFNQPNKFSRFISKKVRLDGQQAKRLAKLCNCGDPGCPGEMG